MTPTIRESADADLPAIEALYPAAFPDEDLLPVVRALLTTDTGVLSLIALDGADLVGHVAFTDCRVDDPTSRPALLAPLAVAPHAQRQGVGGALIREGVARLSASGATQVFVLGDPGYYARHGFEEADDVAPPYPLPRQWKGAWRSRRLSDASASATATATATGRLRAPDPWNDPALWAPP